VKMSKAAAVLKIERLLTEGRILGHDAYAKDCPSEEVEDEVLLKRARVFFGRNMFCVFLSMLYGLVSLMYVPSIVRVLAATGKSDSKAGSFARYLNTINHVLEWHGDPHTRWKSLGRVRRLHAAANSVSLKKHGVAMTQYDMVVTQWAFVAPLFIFSERVGLRKVTDDDLKAVAHHMWVIGYVLGVSEDFNLCGGSLEEVRAYCREVHLRVIKPCLESPPKEGVVMAGHLINGMELFNPFIRDAIHQFLRIILKSDS
jgi:hypothetical protein